MLQITAVSKHGVSQNERPLTIVCRRTWASLGSLGGNIELLETLNNFMIFSLVLTELSYEFNQDKTRIF